MRSLINYLYRHSFIALVLATVYFLSVVLPHEAFGEWIAEHIGRPLGRERFNNVVLITAAVGLSILARFVTNQLRGQAAIQRKNILIALVYVIALIVVAYCTLMVINVEMIHLLQYAIMAILLMPIFKNHFDVFCIATIMGALDEWYQYVILAPEKNDYFDFNDVILNMLGVMLGLIFLRVMDYKSSAASRFASKAGFIGLIAVSAMTFLMYFNGIISFLPPEGDMPNLIFSFTKVHYPDFWHKVPLAKPFHVVKPLEAFFLISVLTYIWYSIIRRW